MEAQNLSSQDQDGLADSVMESLGEPKESIEEAEASGSEGHAEHEALPKGVKERLGRQERKHQREMREMQSRVDHLHSLMNSQPNMEQSQNQMANPYDSGGNPGNVEEQIHKAVGYALQHRELEERKAQEMQHVQHIEKQRRDLHKHLDNIADKYDDFDDVVRGDAPFTTHMRDAAMILPKNGAGSAGEVLYKLGKNPNELERISKLPSVDQISELVRLSHALMGMKESSGSQSRQLDTIKSTPVSNSRGITDKTSVSELRSRMKQGWK